MDVVISRKLSTVGSDALFSNLNRGQSPALQCVSDTRNTVFCALFEVSFSDLRYSMAGVYV